LSAKTEETGVLNVVEQTSMRATHIVSDVKEIGFKMALQNYEEVKDRIPLFYERFPDGRIITQIISEDDGHVTIMASLFKDDIDQAANTPLSTGIAREEPGGNVPAYTENCETSAIGRALANYNLYGNVAKGSGKRPSKEEMTSNIMSKPKPASATSDLGHGICSKHNEPYKHTDAQISAGRLPSHVISGSNPTEWCQKPVTSNDPDVIAVAN